MSEKNGSLRVVAVQVKDVLGAREFSMEPGRGVTILSGPNGSGKSTALSALQAVLGGGNLAKLARVDPKKGRAEEPEVVLVIEGDGAEAYRVRRKGTSLDIKARADMLAHVRSLVAEEGVSVLWATHLVDEVSDTDDVAVLHHGRVLAHGPVPRVITDAGARDIGAAFARLTERKISDSASEAA